MKVLTVFGTRPDAIKMLPLVLELKKHEEIECKVCLTGQHKEMLRQVMEAFGIQEDYNLDIMRKQQTLTMITTDILDRIEPVIVKEKPDIILVHGDTTTSFAATLAAFYHRIPVGHIEAGLRTGNIYSPYPEEMNRSLIGKLATYHFAPTKRNKDNLNRENIYENVYITGNTVIDAFKSTVKKEYSFHNHVLQEVDYVKKRIILMTAHRRENLGTPLVNICKAIRQLAKQVEDIQVIYPVHMNPEVREIVYGILDHCERVSLIEPLDVLDMHNLR